MSEVLKRLASKEYLKELGKRLLVGAGLGSLSEAGKRYFMTVKSVHNFARDKLKRPDYAGHIVMIPGYAVGAVVAKDYDPDVATAMMFKAGDLAGEIVARELEGEPIIRLYTDHIELERFDKSANIDLYIDGEKYDASKFQTPAEYGTVDTTNNVIVTDADGKFSAKFATPIPEGEHTVCATTGQKGKCIKVEI